MTTQFARASYQEIIDLKTTTDTVSVVGIHCPTSMTPYNYLTGFFRQFKKYRYLGCSLALVPSARLPADISQVGYEGGQAPIDARDILNPILFHGCHGNALGPILDGFLNGPSSASSFGSPEVTPSTEQWKMGFGSNAAFSDLYESLYYRALTDNTWLKAHPQAGFRKKGMRPLIYDVSTNHSIGQLARPHAPVTPVTMKGDTFSATTAAGQLGPSTSQQTFSSNRASALYENAQIGRLDIHDPQSNQSGNMYVRPANEGNAYFTSRLHPLGWIDTTLRVMYQNDTLQRDFAGLAPTEAEVGQFVRDIIEMPNVLPLLYMGIIMLPPAYKANQYMRLILNHHFAFKGFRGISTNSSWKGQADLQGGSDFNSAYYPIDTGSKDGGDDKSFGVETEVLPDVLDDELGFDDEKSYL